MIELANLAAVAGLAVAAVPVVVHLANRRRVKRLDWGAMRFLQDALAKRKRRLALDRWLLLAIRTLLLVCVAAALLRPQWIPETAGGDRLVRSGRTSAVLLIDDSPSTAAGTPGAQGLDRVKALALAYLDTLAEGDAVSVVPLSTAADAVGDPLYDLTAARALVAKLQPAAAAVGAAAGLEAGMQHLARHVNPNAEVVLVGDGGRESWADPAAVWDGLRLRLGGDGDRAGSRQRPHLILLTPPAPAAPANLAVIAVAVDRLPVVAGAPTVVRVGLRAVGRDGESLLRLVVDGRVVDERRITVTAGTDTEVAVRHAFTPGEHLVEARLVGHRDDLAIDDVRASVVLADDRLPLLIIEGTPGREATDLGGSLGAAAAALTAGDGFFAPRRISAVEFAAPGRAAELLGQVRLAILGPVSALDPATVGAIERFVVAGGGLLVVAGPESDREHMERAWYRGGDGFLPCSPGAAAGDLNGVGQTPASAGAAHPALAAFAGPAAAAWAEIRVRRALRLPAPADAPADLERMLGLADGTPLLVARARGQGRVAFLATALDGSWSDLPWRPACVPLLRGVCGWLAGRTVPPRVVLPGAQIIWPGEVAADGAVIVDPAGVPRPLAAGTWEGLPCLTSPPLTATGGWLARAGGRTMQFACALDPAESALLPVDDRRIAEVLQTRERFAARDATGLGRLIGVGAATAVELWRWLLLAALVLLVLEALYTRRVVLSERGAAEAR
jgi:hypothetical protein